MPSCPMGFFLYTIRPGDTLWIVAKHYHTTIYAIAAANPGISLSNLYIGQPICIPEEHGFSQHAHPAPDGISKREEDLNNLLRMLWEQHVTWTRLTILSIVFDLPDAQPVTDRLLRNPEDFKSALEPLYGNMAASRFADLLTSHLVIAAQLVKAAKAGDSAAAANIGKSWYANADEIAAFLGSINPYWSENDWRAMLHEHLALIKSEVVDMLNKNYKESVSVYDQIEKEALQMADVMRNGIVRQFPNLF